MCTNLSTAPPLPCVDGVLLVSVKADVSVQMPFGSFNITENSCINSYLQPCFLCSLTHALSVATVKPCGMYDVQWLVADSEIMAAKCLNEKLNI